MTVKSLRKQLAAAIAMTLVATVALGSSTYAWFAMNTVVKADHMQVQAVAEKGLLINEVNTANDTHWDEVATAAQSTTATLLYPASTADGATWYHAASKKSANSASATSGQASDELIGTYENLTTGNKLNAITTDGVGASAVAGTNAERVVYGATATAEAGYYVMYTYYLKGAAGVPVTLGTTAGSMNVSIKSVTATPATAASTALDSSLRVGIKMNSEFYIYAPISGATTSYYVAAGTTATEPKAANTVTYTDLATLPAAGTDGVPVYVYIWFEGEDTNCKSDNALATALDQIAVEINFELGEVPTP